MHQVKRLIPNRAQCTFFTIPLSTDEIQKYEQKKNIKIRLI